MNDLVTIKCGEPFTNSLLVAEKFHKDHKHILDKIRFLAAEISATKLDENYNPKFIESSYKDNRGKTYPLYYLNQDAFVEVVGNLNGKEARQWKREYHAAFNKLAKMIVNRQNAEWIDARHDVKSYQKFLNDMLKDLVDYAVQQGCKHADKLYINYNRLINKTLGIDPASRDQQPAYVLHEIRKLQAMIETTVRGLMHKHVPYKQIYQDCKSTLTSYSQLAFIGQQRFIA